MVASYEKRRVSRSALVIVKERWGVMRVEKEYRTFSLGDGHFL
jgi:hypothetical protein